ncbi:heme anaerobic degradation radical SAM methyltransferase ChuW/HutW [Veillonella caviae]|uniref:heme anaerobic degradation radical SAM methyltransferase ChuW/HutW n=1 Tax=Veillonella caviae TaxID=248316 RepID=UPI0023A84DD3|nr:heme anaerobic degradation radical SAM methyltransferase ChuW/HutW [Veillonella caviae]MCI5708398.1 heme anaerobic degradation radical SAM methyltransferase ChuW/HutW [Veillonella caviae]MDD7290801.1 heme anaerobic degradation radical SAM methyltransferase ChuW/HutW [Veillonella caviae]MDY5409522.1 heme anaerobic degradation radical SAM methyltransferase ChuW/HutW [Veillonella caviae]MDY5714583.1 heme anaerobic degradation radical SAM methyltransferase ChuW/HutW [Veillonella caviae]
MSLASFFESIPEKQRNLQLGLECDNPMSGAFPHKRVVHAGLNGTLISPKESQAVWDTVMSGTPKKGQMQCAYIHIPFCKTKCTYCGFFQNGTSQNIEDQYIDGLIGELKLASESPRLKEGLIHAVFIGGGTPTSLSPANSERLLKAIKEYLPLANDYELTLEGRIHDLIPENLEVWMSNGVNRMSIGVQSFNTKVRQMVGRLDTKETVLERLATLKSYGQCSVVIDLIFGLPGQTMDVWEQDLADLVSSGVDGADLYQLNVFDGSDLNRDIVSGKVPPAATTAMQGEMFEFGRTYLEARAYRRLSSAHWSANNRERSLYNMLAKAGVPMFPFGSGAGGNVDCYGMMLHRALKPYEDMVSRGEKPFMALMKQSDLQPFVNQVVSQLEQGYLNINTLVAMDSRLGELHWLYKLWEERGLVTYNGLLYKLTAAGEFWTVNITQSTLEAMEYIMTGKNSFALESVAAQDTKTTSKENPNQEVRGIGQGKANISVPTDEDTEVQRKEALIAKAKEEIAKSGASGESANRMIQAMYNLSADEIEYMMERMMS